MIDFSIEIELDGLAVLNWMKEAGLEKAKKLLIGLEIDDGTADHLWQIIDIEPSWIVIIVFDGKQKRVPPGLFNRSIVIETRKDAPLQLALESALSDGERSIKQAQSELRQLKFPVGKLASAADAVEALDMMRDYQNGDLPTAEQQTSRYDIIRRANLHGLGAKIIRQWLDLSWKSKPQVDGRLLIKLIYCLRHSGDLNEALKASDLSLSRSDRIVLSQMQKSIIATERAAVLLDLYEARREPHLLIEARKSAGLSYAISQSEEVSAVYQRLKKLESEK